MEGHLSVMNGKGTRVVLSGAVVGVILSAFGLLYANQQMTSREAKTALKVAAQHGEEFNFIRGELSAIRDLVAMTTADRFSGDEANDRFRTVNDRLHNIETRLERIEAVLLHRDGRGG
jgi:tetrahydromethanopterin S-methyltransferase subunit G